MKISKKGFTLIELMVVIAIIGILSAVMLESFSAAKSQSRDVKRISDLSNIQLALAGYFNRCGQYPAADTGVSNKSIIDSTTLSQNTNCPSGISLSTFIATIPTPPNSGEVYSYVTDSGYDDYFLHATLENQNKASNNSLASAPTWCTSGSDVCGSSNLNLSCTGTTDYCVGPK
jgi:prepilin-type N-terminal cleavage/methylation domain-containing protein